MRHPGGRNRPGSGRSGSGQRARRLQRRRVRGPRDRDRGRGPSRPDDVLNAGAVTVIYGSSAGLDATGPPADQFWHEEVAGVRGSGKGDDGFGAAVAAGDFDGDGAPTWRSAPPATTCAGRTTRARSGCSTAATTGSRPTATRCSPRPRRVSPAFRPTTTTWPARWRPGDFDADGYDDVAATLEGQRVDGAQNAGALLVFKGSNGGLKAGGAKLFTEGTPGIAGEPAAVRRIRRGSRGGGLQGEGPGRARDRRAGGLRRGDPGAGTVRVLFGGRGGLTANGDRRIDADQGSISGNAEQDDHFGSSLAGRAPERRPSRRTGHRSPRRR